MSESCPVAAPKLLKAESTVETCAGCGAWVERYPAFMGEADGFWQCEKCGSTAVNIRKGRIYGPESKAWAWISQQFEELYLDIPHWDWDTIVTEPPMQVLDWAAIEAWFRSKHIYRAFISVEVMDVSKHTPIKDGDQ